jgi:RimJ/RimL family protein N-acetyltransferase
MTAIAEIGYWLEESSWGKGIATKAIKDMTNHVSPSQENLTTAIRLPHKWLLYAHI